MLNILRPSAAHPPQFLSVPSIMHSSLCPVGAAHRLWWMSMTLENRKVEEQWFLLLLNSFPPHVAAVFGRWLAQPCQQPRLIKVYSCKHTHRVWDIMCNCRKLCMALVPFDLKVSILPPLWAVIKKGTQALELSPCHVFPLISNVCFFCVHHKSLFLAPSGVKVEKYCTCC